ncbi:hypothetical protein SAMN04489716_5275 [Actinoplanes derwentensis]|uniref:Uncharacterized protein n=1 Tax=Actinoplanes derwentensis TaxID=113562 RepID=A0A1H2C5F2_9ACTN|nr:hypothetical protein SAMN04489716_5275 [Actinoplanes derwentensis]
MILRYAALRLLQSLGWVAAATVVFLLLDLYT